MAFADMLFRTEGLFTDVSFYLNKIVIALVIILIGFVIGKVVENLLRKLLAKLNVDERFAKIFNRRRNYARAIRRTIVRLIYLATIIIALQKLSLIQPTLTILIFLAIIVALISLVLAGIDVAPNIMARAALRHKRIAVGDEVVFSGESGVVQGTIVDMTLIDVRIKRRNGDIFFIPNAVFLHESIVKKRKVA
jgi:small-conductance mechanosensitive channel